MSSAPAPGQTPCVFLKGGAGGFFSKACKAALAKFGYTPEQFGSYDYVKKQIDAAKAEGGAEAGAVKGFVAGSQSGHMAQNAIFQGERGDPCSNKGLGAYGYAMGNAPCMPHHGGSTVKGTTHQKITVEEMANAKAEGGPPGTPLNQKQIENLADKTLDTAIDGPNQEFQGKDPKDLEKIAADAKKLKNTEANEEAKRRGQQAGSGAAQARAGEEASTGADGAKGGKAAKGKKKGPTAADRKKAKECAKAFWKKGMDEMRNNHIENHSSANKLKGKNGEKADPDEVAKRKADVKAKVDKGKATAEECREFQANELEDYKKKNKGKLPPLAGSVPGAGSKGAGGASGKQGKKNE